MNNRKFSIYIPLLLAVSMVAGIFLGIRLTRTETLNPARLSFGRGNKLNNILDLIANYYVDSVSTDKLVEESIPDILKRLDPHTTYIPAREMVEVEEEMRGNFGGIGVQFSIQNDTVMVVDVVSGGPSSKLGIIPGDRIVQVNDTLIAGVKIQNNDVLKKLRGEIGTKVKVGIKRKGIKEIIDFNITRGEIPIYSVDVSYMIDPQTGYIKVSRFAEKTYEEFMEAMNKIDRQGARKVIVDLRGNTGGYLTAVIRMVNEFLPQGALIVYTEGHSQPKKTYNADAKGKFRDKEIVVLIDDFSASASEIFSGAIQDNDRGWLVGRRSFGKGLVQEQIPFNDGSALRLTVARYYTPSGRCIQKSYEKGTDEYYHDLAERAEHGEFQQADSIQFNDSLKYQTIKGRTVYGGGGIMPDYFVPADTSGYSPYFQRIVQKGLIYQFALDYADRNRETLKHYTKASEFEKYLRGTGILQKFVAYASAKGVSPNDSDLNISGMIIETQTMAYIARNIIGEEGFYPIIANIDNALQKAVAVSKLPMP
jgi:carboxyl-terminal processing protease